MIRAIVTDIEGTTSSLAFVKDVLFPYARQHLGDYIRRHADDLVVIEQLEAVRAELRAGQGAEAASAATPTLTLDEMIALLQQWIDEDRKLTPLKALQGLVWEQGYANGDFFGHVYADAAQVLKDWHASGLALYIYSSGSVQAQRLLFNHTEFGDLTPLFSGYFDTRIGAKGEVDSYRRIAATIDVAAEEILFLSDTDIELDAAEAAGLQTCKLIRDGELLADSPYRQARTFSEIEL